MALMTEEQSWAFELDGYILLPSLLEAQSAAHATPTALAEHPGVLHRTSLLPREESSSSSRLSHSPRLFQQTYMMDPSRAVTHFGHFLLVTYSYNLSLKDLQTAQIWFILHQELVLPMWQLSAKISSKNIFREKNYDMSKLGAKMLIFR